MSISSNFQRFILTVAFLFAGNSFVYATGTAQNTDLNSALTINYAVASTSQTDVTDTQTFKVDRKVDVDVTTTDTAKTVTPGTTLQYVTFTITNEGNGTQGYRLTLSHTDSGGILASGPNIYVDDGDDIPELGTGDTAYTSGSAVNIGDLAQDTARKVYVSFNINTAAAGAANGETASFILKAASTNAATATETTANTGAANTAGSVDTVHSDAAGDFAGDALYDGDHSDTAGITVQSATLAITPTMTVLYDNNPSAKVCATMAVGTADANSKAIPGSCIHFLYSVANSGSVSADSVVFTVDLPNELIYRGTLSTEDDDCAVYTPPTVGTSGNVVCNMGTLTTSTPKTVAFRVTVN